MAEGSNKVPASSEAPSEEAAGRAVRFFPFPSHAKHRANMVRLAVIIDQYARHNDQQALRLQSLAADVRRYEYRFQERFGEHP